jgi:hypothetical protein
MQQIIIEVTDEAKARILVELLGVLDFVHRVRTRENNTDMSAPVSKVTSDFFSLAGLWASRDVSLESIRQQAWHRQQR